MHKIKIVVFLLSVYGAMTRFRHNMRHCDVIMTYFLNFYSNAKFGRYDVTIGVTWNEINQLTGNVSTFFPAKFRYIRCILLLSMD